MALTPPPQTHSPPILADGAPSAAVPAVSIGHGSSVGLDLVYPDDGGLSDAEREMAIKHAGERLQFARTPEAVRAAWAALCEMVSARSPDQVERMERAKGLR